jgi:hypothetical protein
VGNRTREVTILHSVARNQQCTRERGLLRKAISTAAILVCACSSSSPLDPHFAGTWNGTLTVSLATIGSLAPIQSPFVVVVSGNTATSGNCTGGTQHYTGSGDSMSSSDVVTCPAQAMTVAGVWSCSSVLITYTKGKANLNNNTVTLVVTGTAVGCGGTYGATLAFTGVQGLAGGPGFAGPWQTYANGWNINGQVAGWSGTSWNPGQGTLITGTTNGSSTIFTQTDATKKFWLNSLRVETADNITGTVTTPSLVFNMGTSFSLGGFGYNCTIQTTNWVWDPVKVTVANTVCGAQNWLVISGSGTFNVADVGSNCTASDVGLSVPGQLSWFLSSGGVPCGTTWVQTWATAGEEPYDYGPWYLETVALKVNWSAGVWQAEGAMQQSPAGPVGMTSAGNNNLLVIHGVTITMTPTTLYDAVPVDLGDSNPNWASNVAAYPPPNGANIQCGSAVVFVPQTVSAIARTIEAGFYGALSLTRLGYITGCGHCDSSGCNPQHLPATEVWAYAGPPNH